MSIESRAEVSSLTTGPSPDQQKIGTAAIDPRLMWKIRGSLAANAYDRGHVRLADPDHSGADCLVASRQGVFAVAETGLVRQLLYGFFFGITAHGDHLYLFEGYNRGHTARGRVVRLRVRNGQLEEPTVLVRGLNHQIHQLRVFDDQLHLVSTAQQAIIRLALDGSLLDTIEVLPGVTRHLHINSIAERDDEFLLLFHNGENSEARQSELGYFDRQWRLLRVEPLPGNCCHDIVPDASGGTWHCGSMAGELITPDRRCIPVARRMTRGLAITDDRMIVGCSDFGERSHREHLAGGVIFLDRQGRIRSVVELPAAPTDIALLAV